MKKRKMMTAACLCGIEKESSATTTQDHEFPDVVGLVCKTKVASGSTVEIDGGKERWPSTRWCGDEHWQLEGMRMGKLKLNEFVAPRSLKLREKVAPTSLIVEIVAR